MQVILLKDVARLGRRHEIKEVPSGHALNMLIPQGHALPATPENMKRLKNQTEKAAAENEGQEEAFRVALEALKDKVVTITAEANDKGHLFKAVNADDIVAALRAEEITIPASSVTITEVIKEVGTHTVELSSKDHSGEVKVEVVSN